MEKEIKIYLSDTRVDVSALSKITIKKQYQDVKEFSKKKTSFTKPITILYTQSNHRLFKNAFHINENNGWDRNSTVTARITVGGYEIMTGLAKLDAITEEGYAFIIYKDEANLTATFADELIKGNADSSKDISFSNQYSFNNTRPNVRALLQSPPRVDGKGINYGFIDYVGINNYDYYKDRLFTPSIAARELLEEMLFSIGKTVTFSDRITKYLNHLYIPFNSEHTELTTEWQYAKYGVKSALLVPSETSIYGATDWHCNYDKMLDISNVNAPEAGYIRIKNEYGNYKVKLYCKIKKTEDNNEAPEVLPKIVIRTEDVNPNFETSLKLTNLTAVNQNEGIILNDANYHIAAFEASFTLKGGDNYLYYGFTNRELPEKEGDILLDPDGISNRVEITKVDSFFNEDTPNVITADKILPVEYKKIDFFNDIINTFNAVVTTNGNRLYISTLDEFLFSHGTIKDDLKIDDSTVKLRTLLSKRPEILSFEMSESDDLYNADFKDQYDYNLADLARLDSAKNEVTKSITYANTIRVNEFSTLLNKDGDFSTRFAPRLLFINSINVGTMRWGLDVRGVRDNHIQYLHILSNRFSEDPAATDNVILAFENKFSYSGNGLLLEDTNATLLKAFYANSEFALLKNNLMVLTADFNLNSKQFTEMKFNDIFLIKTAKYGTGYYRLNLIKSYNLSGDDLTEIEFAQIDTSYLNGEFFSASKINLSSVYLTPSSESTKDSFTAVSGGTSSSGVSYEQVTNLLTGYVKVEDSVISIAKGRLTDLSDRSISITFDAFNSIPNLVQLDVYRMWEPVPGNWQRQEVLYKFTSANPLTTTSLSFKIDISENLSGVIIEYIIQ